MPSPADTVIDAARAFLGERITTNATLRDHHSHGQDTQPPVLPDAVAFVETAEEVARVLALCHAAHVPVVAWGAGTSLEGHVTPVRGGITLDLSHMTRIIDVSQPDMDCRIEAGVTRDQLNTYLRDVGLFFPVDPGTSLCTIGGMCATRASGTNAVRYGTMRENVLGLTVAVADGRLIRTGGRVRKSVHRLRPDAVVHRVGGHAGGHHRNPVAAARHSRGDVVRHLPVPDACATRWRR